MNTAEKELVVGAFYWVIPVLDPDADAEWEQGLQPARFAGMANGVPTWNALNVEGVSDWPMRYIGTRVATGDMHITPEMIHEAEAHLPFEHGSRHDRWNWLAWFLNEAMAHPDRPCQCCGVTPRGEITVERPE